MRQSRIWVGAAYLFVGGLLLWHFSSGSGPPPGMPAAAAAEPGVQVVTPDIKKGVKIRAGTVDQKKIDDPVTVLEVRGKWVQLDFSGHPYWYNTDNFVWFEVVK